MENNQKNTPSGGKQAYDLSLFEDKAAPRTRSSGAHYSSSRSKPRTAPARAQSVQQTPARPVAPVPREQPPVYRQSTQPAPRRSGSAGGKKPKTHRRKLVNHILISVLAFLLMTLTAAYSLLYTLTNGPSQTIRNLLVLSAKQASATKWLPGLFLSQATIEEIMENSKVVNVDTVPLDEYTPSTEPTQSGTQTEDEWANAIDGVLYETVNGPTYKAYVMLIKDPSRVYVATSSDYKSGQPGAVIFDVVERENALAAINGGEFTDIGGVGTGDTPIGLTYAGGTCVWDDGIYWKTFIGITNDNTLVVSEGMSRDKADSLGMRDGVCFQNDNLLISNDGGNVSLHYYDDNTGTAQRTAIGQRADGTIIMAVTDGRTASSLGATHNDMVDLMYSYGAVSAAKLDGGSSSLMYYRNYYDLYNIDKATLDEYQLKGLVNKYKAFTTPRKIPTYFCVKG